MAIKYTSELIHRPKQWVRLKHNQITTGTAPFVDLRVACYEVDGIAPDLKITKNLATLGGIWHDYKLQYVNYKETPFDKEPSTIWYFNKSQVKVFESIKKVIDPDVDIPIGKIIAFGGRRTGKSEGGVRVGAGLLLIKPGSIGEVWGYDFKHNIDNTGGLIDKFRGILPRGAELHFDKLRREMLLRNRSVIQFKSAVTPKSARSGAPDWAILDEPSFYDNTEKVIEALEPALIEKAGPMIMITSPNGYDEIYYQSRKRFSPDPMLRKSMIYVDFGGTYDNPFLNKKSRKVIEIKSKDMSRDAYMQEIEGKIINTQGLVFYDFERDVHVKKQEEIERTRKDITSEFTNQWLIRLAHGFDIIAGMDFNENPISFNAFRVYEGGLLHCFDEISMYNANTIKFSTQFLIPWLQSLYPDLDQSELVKKILIIGDASGQWQETGKQRREGKYETPAFRNLKSFGFTVIPPIRRSRYKINKNGKKVLKRTRNPLHGERMATARTRLLTHEDVPYIGVDPRCEETIKMLESIDLDNGLPNKKSKFIHRYDSFTYPQYRIFPFCGIDPNIDRYKERRNSQKIIDDLSKEYNQIQAAKQ